MKTKEEFHRLMYGEPLYMQQVGRAERPNKAESVANRSIVEMVRDCMRQFAQSLTLPDTGLRLVLNDEQGKKFNSLGEILNRFIDDYNVQLRHAENLREELREARDEAAYAEIKNQRLAGQNELVEDEIIKQTLEVLRYQRELAELGQKTRAYGTALNKSTDMLEKLNGAFEDIVAQLKAKNKEIELLKESNEVLAKQLIERANADAEAFANRTVDEALKADAAEIHGKLRRVPLYSKHGEPVSPMHQPVADNGPVAIPEGVYYSDEHNNFYDHTSTGMGVPFWKTWFPRRAEFPTHAQPVGNAVQELSKDIQEVSAVIKCIPVGPDLLDAEGN